MPPLAIIATPGSAALSLMENVSSKRDITGKIDRAKFRGLEGGKVELPPNASTAPDLNPSPDARARGGLKHKAVVPGSSSPVRRIALAGWLAGWAVGLRNELATHCCKNQQLSLSP